MKIKNTFLIQMTRWFLTVLFTAGFISCFSQNIGINNTGATADASAILDVNAPNKGLLIPRLSAARRNAIASPATGLFIFDTSINQLEYWNGSSWIQLANTSVAATNASGTNTGRSIAISASSSQADQSAILDIQSNTGGLLLPRMNGTQRDAIPSPVTGLIIYNSSSAALNFYSASGWQQVCGTSISSATGAITTPANVGINTASPDPSAMLDITSVTSGLAIPRLSSAQRDAILSPAQGLMLFNTTTQSVNIYNGAGNWLNFIAQAPPVAPIAGTNTATQTQVTWNWNAASGASGYKYNTANNYNTATDNGTNTSYIQTGLGCNTSDTLYVWSYNCGGNSQPVTLTQTTSACTPGCGGATTMTDSRDGTVYPIVQIGAQCWFAENLNIGTYVPLSVGGLSNNGIIEKYCQNSSGVDDNTCPYGGLYDFAEAVQYINGETDNTSWSPAPTGNVQGVCPAGWHIPTNLEWCTMLNTVDATTNPGCSGTGYLGSSIGLDLKASSPLWDGNNSSGFTGLPGGYSSFGSFNQAGFTGNWWTSTDGGSDLAWFNAVVSGYSTIYHELEGKQAGYSVRCVKN